MRRILAIIIVFFIITTVAGRGEDRRMPQSEERRREGLVYIVNEQTPYTGIIFTPGKCRSENTYKAGKLDGVAKSWDSKGQLRYEVTYKAGRPDGGYKSWDSKGNPEVTWMDGKPVSGN